MAIVAKQVYYIISLTRKVYKIISKLYQFFRKEGTNLNNWS